MGNQIKKILKPVDIWAVLLILIGSTIWSLTMIKSGLRYNYGIGFWGPNGHDGVWHLAIINSLAKGTWEMPIFAGEVLKNYHIGFDLFVAILHKLTFIPTTYLYFQILPPIFAVLIGILVYKLVYNWTGSKMSSFWSTFLTYFSGSLGWVVTYIRDGDFGGESLFWSQQSFSTLINPPFAMSLVLMLFGLIILQRATNKKERKQYVLATFIFGILIQIKVYAGLLSLGALAILGLYKMLKREGLSIFKVFSGALVLSLILFFSTSGEGGATLVFKPFWFLESMMATPDRFYWPKFAEAMMNYKMGKVWLKGTLAYLAGFIIFILGNFGLRIIGLVWFIEKAKRIRELNDIDLFSGVVILVGIIIPTFFIQSGNSWN